MEQILLNKDTKHWNDFQLATEYEPINNIAWRWGPHGRTASDRDAHRYFIAETLHPILDPWRRPFLEWKCDNSTISHTWVGCSEEEHRGYQFRYASIRGKLTKLYLKLSS